MIATTITTTATTSATNATATISSTTRIPTRRSSNVGTMTSIVSSSESYNNLLRHLVTVVVLLVSLLLPQHQHVSAVPISLHGINYSIRQGADWEPDKCKQPYQIMTDLSLLRRITDSTRVLSLTDCGQGELVLQAAKELDMTIWLGMWVGPDEFGDVFDQEKDELVRMLDAGMIDTTTVLGITVGSEAIYRGDATIDQMIFYLGQVRNLLTTYNLDLPVSIVDVAPIYSNSVELRTAVDVIYTNTFPFWEATPIDDAVAELETDIGWLLGLPESQGKPFIMGETGWPSAGYIEGVGVASAANQQQYFVDAFCYMEQERWGYYWFTGIDNAWRQVQDPNNTIEGNWGFLYANLTLKEHFVDLIFTCPHNGVEYSFGEIDWTIPTDFTAAPTALDPASCSVHRSCTGLLGMCCPTENGDFLGCCDTAIQPGMTPTNPPTTEPVTASPTVGSGSGTNPDPTNSPTSVATPAPTAASNPPPTSPPTTTPATPAPTVASGDSNPTPINNTPTSTAQAVPPAPTPDATDPANSPTTTPLVPVSAFPPTEAPVTTTPPSSATSQNIRCFGLSVSSIVFTIVASYLLL